MTPFEKLMTAIATDEASGAGFDAVKLPNGDLTATAPLDGMDERPKVVAMDSM